MPLEQAFSLTPRDSFFRSGPGDYAGVSTYCTVQLPMYTPISRASFDHQHVLDELYFYKMTAGDPTVDYTQPYHRKRVPRVQLAYNLSSFGPNKEVALTFRFDAISESRVLVCMENELVGEEILHVGDNQFLIEVESTARLLLQFLHVNRDGFGSGGNWFFQGIDGYIA
jgi:hypothetical protein